ncbi:hypothetical protein ACDQ54_05920 [Fusobacterium animalis]|jgi:hypothetical protein|uniref:hypothetical protein n=1 Tax=Fusobacterium animalis TaxID=76859 RepID=UPI003556474D
MSEFNEFLIKIEKIRNNLFLITVFLITILLFKWFIMIIKEAEKENKKKNKREKNFIFRKITWILIYIVFFVLMRDFLHF